MMTARYILQVPHMYIMGFQIKLWNMWSEIRHLYVSPVNHVCLDGSIVAKFPFFKEQASTWQALLKRGLCAA